jgi:DNA-directed RNA polymerase specialized sigma24 family protein
VSLDDEGEPVFLRAPGASPDDHAALRRVHRALDAVPPKARVAWALRYLEQERLEDVARLCRCSIATAKRRGLFWHSVHTNYLI